MTRQASGRSRNITDLVNLGTREMQPGFRWVRMDADDSPLYLQRVPVPAGGRSRITSRRSRRDVRQALNAFRKLAQEYEEGQDDVSLMIAVAGVASRYGPLYGDVPKPGALAYGTLDDWKLELLRFLDLWELAQALQRPSRERAVSSRVQLRSADASGPERFVFLPRTADLDGELMLATGAERYTWIDATTGIEATMPIFQRMQAGDTRTRLWITFTTLVNRGMKGRLNLALHPFERASAGVSITPDGLLATVTARLWLDVVTAREESTPQTRRTCAHCGAPLPETATARMAFCGATCRQAHRRSRHP